MTKAAKKALKSVGIPTVRWSEQYKQFYTRIGYKISATGKRQQAFFYLGLDENEAIAKAVTLKGQWRNIKRGGAIVWPPKKQKASEDVAPAEMENIHEDEAQHALEQGEVSIYLRDRDTGRTQFMGKDTVENQRPRQRIEQVREAYLEYRKGKLGIIGGQGINDTSFRLESRNLKSALASVDQSMLIDSMGYAEIEKLRDDIFRRVGDGENSISKRTANNYWNEIRRMLEWAHSDSRIGYRHPEDVAKLFAARFKNANPINIAKYDAEQLKKLLKSATDRQRLYIYLAMNCGHYPVDIGSLLRDEVTKYEGLPAIVRMRNKTAHQNDFEALHTLWPETAKLLRKEMKKSEDADTDLALLSENGTPLYRRNPICNIVKKTYSTLCERAEVSLAFKQFRKIGSTAIQRIGGDEARRLYKAGTVEDGDKVYVRDSYEKLTPHLIAWGKELRKDGVLF